MESDSRSGGQGKGALEELFRERIRRALESIIDEELEAALGAARSQRVGSVRNRLPARLACTHVDDQLGRDHAHDAAGSDRRRAGSKPRVAQPDDPALSAPYRTGRPMLFVSGSSKPVSMKVCAAAA